MNVDKWATEQDLDQLLRPGLFLLALTVYRVFQRRIRQHITKQNPMHGSGGRILRKPTVAAILYISQIS